MHPAGASAAKYAVEEPKEGAPEAVDVFKTERPLGTGFVVVTMSLRDDGQSLQVVAEDPDTQAVRRATLSLDEAHAMVRKAGRSDLVDADAQLQLAAFLCATLGEGPDGGLRFEPPESDEAKAAATAAAGPPSPKKPARGAADGSATTAAEGDATEAARGAGGDGGDAAAGPGGTGTGTGNGDGDDGEDGGEGVVQLLLSSRKIGTEYVVLTVDEVEGGGVCVGTYSPATAVHCRLLLSPEELAAAVAGGEGEPLLAEGKRAELAEHLAARLGFTRNGSLMLHKSAEEAVAAAEAAQAAREEATASAVPFMPEDDAMADEADISVKKSMRVQGAFYIVAAELHGGRGTISTYNVRTKETLSVDVDLVHTRAAFRKGTVAEQSLSAAPTSALINHLASLLEIVDVDDAGAGAAGGAAGVEATGGAGAEAAGGGGVAGEARAARALVLRGVTGAGLVDVQGFRRSCHVGKSYLLVSGEVTADGDVQLVAFEPHTGVHFDVVVEHAEVALVVAASPDGAALLKPEKHHDLLDLVCNDLTWVDMDGTPMLAVAV